MKVVDLLDMEQRLAVAEKKVARMELRFNSWLTEQCFIYAQIRGEIKYDEREDREEEDHEERGLEGGRDQVQDTEGGLLEPSSGLHGEHTRKVSDKDEGHDHRVPKGKVTIHRQGLCSPVLEKGVRDAK